MGKKGRESRDGGECTCGCYVEVLAAGVGCDEPGLRIRGTGWRKARKERQDYQLLSGVIVSL